MDENKDAKGALGADMENEFCPNYEVGHSPKLILAMCRYCLTESDECPLNDCCGFSPKKHKNPNDDMHQPICPYTDPEGKMTREQAQLAANQFARTKGSFLLFTSEVDFIIHCLTEHALWWTCDVVQQYTTDMLLEVDRMKLISGYKNIAALVPQRGQRDFGRLCEVIINFIKQLQRHVNPNLSSVKLASYPRPLIRWLKTQESDGGTFVKLNRPLTNVTSCFPEGGNPKTL